VEKQKIVLVSLFYYEQTDNIRITTIYNLLKEKSSDVELITTDFNHRTKQKHDASRHPSDITFLPVPEYRRNVSFRRLFSHLVFAVRLFFYLRKLPYRPSKVYCLVPAVTAGLACHHYCKKKQIPFVVDVIDLWPESFIVLSSYKKLLRFVTFPWKKIAEKVYQSADLLFAGSVQYAHHAEKFNRKTKAVPVYLGTDTKYYKTLVSSCNLSVKKPENQKWICFGGMLGNSYDIDIILESFKKLSDKRDDNVKLIFVGDGPMKAEINRFKQKYDLNIEITGFLSYACYMKYLSYADVAINSFRRGTEVAYSYKFNDYLTAGVPVLNNVKGEMAGLITRYNLGRNFHHAVDSLYGNLDEMIGNPGLLTEMRKNATFVATTILDKKTIYREMIEKLIS